MQFVVKTFAAGVTHNYNVDQSQATLLMTLDFRQYIALTLSHKTLRSSALEGGDFGVILT